MKLWDMVMMLSFLWLLASGALLNGWIVYKIFYETSNVEPVWMVAEDER